ncbi:hypothetical protein GGS23DRAFT_612043 [Durotheca rogersii]|uniref:uncharacterized protein n=1 Tax=Durotheca rogersii TaxID=419775 RepID=UPI00221FC297|nr:uncharacterized protein GGS23DRAFT_612043 [Durotheca rogersii]KAI5861484.1 hypothetical protein GGS23DRAFT_612043 [Durotheca rogersii]
MDPPMVTRNLLRFWGPSKVDLKETFDADLQSLYSTAYGLINQNISRDQWRMVQWTLDDFAQFYDCEEYAKAWSTFVRLWLNQNLLVALPSWEDVVEALQDVFETPEVFHEYVGLCPESKLPLATWEPIDYICAFIIRLLNYRRHFNDGTAASGSDFEFLQAMYAGSFGSDNPFYHPWDAVDKWAAAYLLYVKLKYECNLYVEDHLRQHPHSFDHDYAQAKKSGPVHAKGEEEFERRQKAAKKHKRALERKAEKGWFWFPSMTLW